jgi:hypothetical protein
MNRRESAETLALQAFGWLVGDQEMLAAFLHLTGASGADLARGARDPAFLGAVLDFVLAEDARVIACAEALDCPALHIPQARAHLPGGDVPHWT